MTLRFPSQTQLKYAQTVLPVSPEQIVLILSEADNETFNLSVHSQNFPHFVLHILLFLN